MGVLHALASRLAGFVVLALLVSTAVVVSGVDLAGARAKPAPPVDLSSLRKSTTHTTLPRAPQDPAPQATTEGEVVHPLRMLALRRSPGGPAFGKIGPRQMGETWLPVIDREQGWVRVLLPSRPNSSSGWLPMRHLELRHTPYLVRVHLGSRSLELLHDGEVVGSWPVAIGAPGTPTPTGRTFLLGSITDDQQSFSPVVLPVGAHSDTLDTYGGGPGTVALHGWPDPSVFGQAVSHGCVRVPADALERLTQVPLGTVVIVDRS